MRKVSSQGWEARLALESDIWSGCHVKNLFMPLFLMGCFPGDFEEGKRPLRHSGKRPIKVGKRPIKVGKRPIKVGKRPIKVGKRPIKEGKRTISANGQLSGTPPRWKTAPLKRPTKRSMSVESGGGPLTFAQGNQGFEIRKLVHRSAGRLCLGV